MKKIFKYGLASAMKKALASALNLKYGLASAIIFLGFLSVGCQETGPEDGPLAAPQSVVCEEVGTDLLKFSWSASAGAERYVVNLTLALDGSVVASRSITRTSYTFTGLDEGTGYICKVKAVSGSEETDWASSEICTTQTSATVGDEDKEEPDVEPVDPAEVYAKMMIPAHEDAHGMTLAFPGAEGGGMFVTGGRGGKIIHVTNLNDSGTGSLRAALSESGARTIVFDVSGVIHLSSNLTITHGDVTIAGQTAPGDGICIADATVQVDADNVIIRFLRFRLGDQGAHLTDGSDTIWGRYHQNIILDHCSMSWSIDELASFYANKNFTMQWCLLAEALNSSLHNKGNHGYGGIWGGRNASFHHNMLANNHSRNARIDHPGIYLHGLTDYRPTHRGNVDYRNNVIYNWGNNSTYGGESGKYNVVGNYYKPGPASDQRNYFVDAYWYYMQNGVQCGFAYPELYMTGNYHAGSYASAINADNSKGVYLHSQTADAGATQTSPSNPSGTMHSSPLAIKADDSQVCYTTTHSAQGAYDAALLYAGASLVRDAVDERVIKHAKNVTYEAAGSDGSTGGIIDSQGDVGGWPEYTATDEEIAALTDTDGDGIPDWFETAFGLNPRSAADAAAKTIDTKGRYSNFEMYLHYLVREIVEGQVAGGSYEALE